MTQPSSFTDEPEGPTEFSWGRGLQPPLTQGGVPTLAEQHRALLATGKGNRSEDTATQISYDDYIREP